MLLPLLPPLPCIAPAITEAVNKGVEVPPPPREPRPQLLLPSVLLLGLPPLGQRGWATMTLRRPGVEWRSVCFGLFGFAPTEWRSAKDFLSGVVAAHELATSATASAKGGCCGLEEDEAAPPFDRGARDSDMHIVIGCVTTEASVASILDTAPTVVTWPPSGAPLGGLLVVPERELTAAPGESILRSPPAAPMDGEPAGEGDRELAAWFAAGSDTDPPREGDALMGHA